MDSEIFRNMLCVLGRLPCGGECTVLYVRVYNDGYGRNDGSFIMVKLIQHTRGLDGVNRLTKTREQFDQHIESCRKNADTIRKDNKKFAKAFTIILDSLGKDAT